MEIVTPGVVFRSKNTTSSPVVDDSPLAARNPALTAGLLSPAETAACAPHPRVRSPGASGRQTAPRPPANPLGPLQRAGPSAPSRAGVCFQYLTRGGASPSRRFADGSGCPFAWRLFWGRLTSSASSIWLWGRPPRLVPFFPSPGFVALLNKLEEANTGCLLRACLQFEKRTFLPSFLKSGQK